MSTISSFNENSPQDKVLENVCTYLTLYRQKYTKFAYKERTRTRYSHQIAIKNLIRAFALPHRKFIELP